jgi:hypothetical protein
MISKAEHAIAQRRLQNLAEDTTTGLKADLDLLSSPSKALNLATKHIETYHAAQENLILRELRSIGDTAAAHYNSVLKLGLSDKELASLVEGCIEDQLSNPYHGVNLQQRFHRTKILSLSRLKKASITGAGTETRKTNMARHLTSTYPYGAQVNIDKRTLLAQSVYLEHEIGKKLAEKADARYVVWLLSEQHSTPDICDTLANAVNKDIEARFAGLSISPRGVYLLKDVPNLPHPNCRCTLGFIQDGELTPRPTRSKTALGWLRGLLKKVGSRARPRV